MTINKHPLKESDFTIMNSLNEDGDKVNFGNYFLQINLHGTPDEICELRNWLMHCTNIVNRLEHRIKIAKLRQLEGMMVSSEQMVERELIRIYNGESQK